MFSLDISVLMAFFLTLSVYITSFVLGSKMKEEKKVKAEFAQNMKMYVVKLVSSVIIMSAAPMLKVAGIITSDWVIQDINTVLGIYLTWITGMGIAGIMTTLLTSERKE